MTYIWDTSGWPRFDYDASAIAPALAIAMQSMGEVAGLKAGLAPADLDDLNRRQLVQEALSSFEIEGVTLNADEIEASVVASLKHREEAAFGRRSDAIVALMMAARTATPNLDAQTLWEWHRLLFHGIEVEDLGQWRSFDIDIVRTASAGPQDVLFKGPPPVQVSAEMTTLLDWLNTPAQDPLPVRAAIAHLWFESIHPFSDGNGRIGRALIEQIFATQQALPFALSRQIERDKRGYYAALQAGRRDAGDRIDATAFVLWFLQILTEAAQAGRTEALFIVRRNRMFAEHGDALLPRQRKVLDALFAQGEQRVGLGLSAKSYRKMSKTSAPTTTRDLRAMEQMGVLERSEAGGRSTTYKVLY